MSYKLKTSEYVTIGHPDKVADYISEYILDRIIAKDPIYITTSCKNPELAAKWLDYQYSDEGCFLNWYGTEGESWTYGADGTPQFTELITNNPDGLPMTELSAPELFSENAAFITVSM